MTKGKLNPIWDELHKDADDFLKKASDFLELGNKGLDLAERIGNALTSTLSAFTGGMIGLALASWLYRSGLYPHSEVFFILPMIFMPTAVLLQRGGKNMTTGFSRWFGASAQLQSAQQDLELSITRGDPLALQEIKYHEYISCGGQHLKHFETQLTENKPSEHVRALPAPVNRRLKAISSLKKR